jgi:hypothetical protein
MSSTDPYANLSQSVLDQVYGLLEPFEGFGGDGHGGLYIPAPGTLADIAYGMNLTDINSMGSVLNALTLTSQVAIGGTTQAFSGNIFQVTASIAAAQGTTAPAPSQIVAYFMGVVQQVLAFGAPAGDPQADSQLSQLQTQLNNALTDYATGNWSGLVPLSLPPTPTTTPLNFILTLPQAETALQYFINGGPNGAPVFGYSVSGKSSQIAATIRSGYNNVAPGGATLNSTSVMPGLDPSSAQWQAIVDASFLGVPLRGGNGQPVNAYKRIGMAMALNDPAQVWYILRYLAGASFRNSDPSRDNGIIKRDYLESALFGLNSLELCPRGWDLRQRSEFR